MKRPRFASVVVGLVVLAGSFLVAAPAWANHVSISTSTPVTDGSAPITFQVDTDADATTSCIVYQRVVDGVQYDGVEPCIGTVELDVTSYDPGKYVIRAISYHPLAGDYVTASTAFWIDQEGPQVVLMTGGSFALGKTAEVKWRAPNEGADGTIYQRQIRRGDVDQGLGGWSDLPDTSKESMELALADGETNCLRVRGTDVLGNRGDWSSVGCVTRPLDERDLDGWQRKDSGWKPIREANFIDQTGLVATITGSSLVLDDARIDTLVIWGRKGPYSGKLEIKVDGKVVATVSLNSKTPKRDVVFRHDFQTTQRGRVVLTVVTAARPVTLDGVGVVSE